jgi:signal transduction histidine kinase
MGKRTASRLAWSLWIVAIGSLIASMAVSSSRGSLGGLNGGNVAPFIAVMLFVPTFATVGALLGSRRPSNPIGWLLLASGLSYGLALYGFVLPKVWGDWLSSWAWATGLAFTGTFALLLFPSGSLLSRRWRPVAWLAGIGLASFVLGNAFAPVKLSGTPASVETNPLGIPGPVGQVFKFMRAGFGLVVVAIVLSLVSVVLRYRRADATEREQMKWLVVAVALIAIAAIAQIPIDKTLGPSELATNLENGVITFAVLLVPVAIGIAVLKYRLYDIDVVINKTLVFGSLAAFITAVYVAIVVGIGAAIGRGSSPNLGLSILATAVVAVAFQPVRGRVQRLANRLVYGKRATPYEVLSEFSARMAGSYAAEDLLPRMARILAEGTGARSAVVWLKVGTKFEAEAAWPVDDSPVDEVSIAGDEFPDLGATLALPVLHRDELLGALSLVKPPGERLTPAEEHLARDLASGAGLVLRNVRLTEELLARLEDLRASRQRIVAAQDAERRKLERNIHDGAQQQLVALAVRLRLAKQLLVTDPERASRMLEDVEHDTTEALADLRDLARGIYPPLLADQGLVAALSAQARKASLPVQIDADEIARYSPEQEAGVYFCILEALQNVAKYAGASKAVIRLSESNGYVAFDVSDDGRGFDQAQTAYGTGLQGMADRLNALGGELDVRSEPGGGTTVTGRLPARTLEPAR